MLHERGSSHGLTRIIRLAYHEHPSYVPLLRRSYELWHELEALAGEELLITTGSIEGGPEDGPTFRGSLAPRSCTTCRTRCWIRPSCGAASRRTGCLRRHHARRVPAGWGFLLAERSLLAHLNQADRPWRRAALRRAAARVGGHRRRWRRDPYRPRDLRGGPAGPVRGGVGRQGGAAAGAAGAPGAPGAGLVPAHARRSCSARPLPGLPARHRGGQPLRLPGP